MLLFFRKLPSKPFRRHVQHSLFKLNNLQLSLTCYFKVLRNDMLSILNSEEFTCKF